MYSMLSPALISCSHWKMIVGLKLIPTKLGEGKEKRNNS
jgi:hypothetical protein